MDIISSISRSNQRAFAFVLYGYQYGWIFLRPGRPFTIAFWSSFADEFAVSDNRGATIFSLLSITCRKAQGSVRMCPAPQYHVMFRAKGSTALTTGLPVVVSSRAPPPSSLLQYVDSAQANMGSRTGQGSQGWFKASVCQGSRFPYQAQIPVSKPNVPASLARVLT